MIASQLPLCPGNGFRGLLGHLSDRNGGSQVLLGTCDVTPHAFHTRKATEGVEAFVQADHLAIRSFGLGVLTRLHQRVAENAVRVGVSRIECNRSLSMNGSGRKLMS